MASISHRHSIRWLPSPGSEPTSTLVLTSASGWYIDIRILHGLDPIPTSLTASEDALLSVPASPPQKLPQERIDWAFSGQSRSMPVPGGDGKARRAEWTHWVDSRTRLDEQAIVDSGEMRARSDGLVVETGEMVPPGEEAVRGYEEVWEDLVVEGKCHVFVHDDVATGSRGVVMRLGSWYQSVWRKANEVRAERWKLEGGKWGLVARLGGTIVDPGEAETALGEGLAVDETAVMGGLTWTYTEVD